LDTLGTHEHVRPNIDCTTTTTDIQVFHPTIIHCVTDSQWTLLTMSQFKSNKDIKYWLCQQPGLKGLGTENIWLATWDHHSTTLTKLIDGDRPPAPRHNFVSVIRMILRLRGGGPDASGNIGSPPTVTQPDSNPLLCHDKRPDHIHMDSLQTVWSTYESQNPEVTMIYPVLSDSYDSGFLHIDYQLPEMNFSCPTWYSQRAVQLHPTQRQTWKVVTSHQMIAIMTASYLDDVEQLQGFGQSLPTLGTALQRLILPCVTPSHKWTTWKTAVCAIVHYANTCKFSNNQALAQKLIQTLDTVITYAHPLDGRLGTRESAKSDITRALQLGEELMYLAQFSCASDTN